jgi:hypothetical protein
MFSKVVVLGVLCLFQSAVLALVVQLGEPLQQGIFLPPLLETYITLALTSLAGLMVGLTISAVAPNNDRAISFVPIILIPQVIFSGAIIALKDWVTQVLAAVFPTRWAMDRRLACTPTRSAGISSSATIIPITARSSPSIARMTPCIACC